jgi:hypothetical protein
MRRYGVSDTTTALIVVRIAGPELSPAIVAADMDAVVQGTKASFERLHELTDWPTIKKVRTCALSFHIISRRVDSIINLAVTLACGRQRTTRSASVPW